MSMPRILAILSLAFLIACAGPSDQVTSGDQKEIAAAETALFGEAIAYQRCMESNHYLPERCQAERETYDAERAAFEARFGERQ
jgi:hypothetical protein